VTSTRGTTRYAGRTGLRRRAAVLALGVAAALLATACSAGSGPALPKRPAQTSAASEAPAPAQKACDNVNPARSFAPLSALPAPGQMPAGSTMAAIQKRGRLIAAVSADTLLFSFRNPVTNQIEGFDVDWVKQVATAILGPNPQIEYRVVNYAQRIPALTSGQVDIVADVMTINCQRWNQIAFSSEYYSAGQKVLVAKNSTAKNIDQLNGKKVCVATGSTNIDELKKHPGVVPVPVPDISDCMVLFQQGKVDAVTGDDTVLAGFVAQDPYAKIVGQAFTKEPYGLGMRLDQKDLVSFVNAVLARDRANGTWAAIYKKWLPGEVPPAPVAQYGREQ
jgi:polar amino acid transport system substrate-binding protein